MADVNNPASDVLKSLSKSDPEAIGAAAASQTMEPVIGGFFKALGGDISNLGQGIWDTIKMPGEIFSGERQPNVPDTTNFALSVLPVRGTLGTIGGVGAKTANMDANAIATLMEVAGARPQSIFKQTGWYRDVDNQWKFEISDKGAELNESAFNVKPDVLHKDNLAYHLKNEQPRSPEGLPRPRTLGDVIHHPELFQAYPEIAKLPVDDLPDYKFGGGLKGVMQGAGTPSEHMGLSPDLPNEVLSTTLHESQHWIQNKENFARGGAPDEFIPAEKWSQRILDLENMRNLNNQLDVLEGFHTEPYIVEEAFKSAIRRDDINPAFQSVLNNLEQLSPELFAQAHKVYSKELAWDNLQRDAFNKYLTLAGESESRNVEARHRFPELESISPRDTHKYPANLESNIPTLTPSEKQIIKMQGER